MAPRDSEVGAGTRPAAAGDTEIGGFTELVGSLLGSPYVPASEQIGCV